MATVRELVVSLGLDFNSSGFAQAEKAIAALKTGMSAVGGVLIGMAAGLTGITVAVTKQADELRDLSLTLGVSTDALQKLGYAAQLSGADAETMRTGLIFLARQAEAAGSGSKDAAANFDKFGVKLRDGNGHLKTADRLLLDVANGAQGLKDPTERAALAAQLLGRSAGPRLVQLLSQGEAGIAELGAELEALGGLMDTDFIEASAEFNDNLDRMQTAVKGFGITIAKAFLPFLSSAVKGIVEWYRANREVINSRVTFFVERMASAFRGLASVIGIAIDGITKVIRRLSETHPIFLTTIAIVGALALAFASPVVAALLLTTLIAALADDINVFVTGGKSVLGEFADFMVDWGNKNGGVLGKFIADVGRFINEFRGAGWGEVAKEANAHFEIFAKTLGTISTILSKIVTAANLVRRAFKTDDFSDVAVEGAEKNLTAKERAQLIVKRKAERDQANADDLANLGLGFGGLLSQSKGAKIDAGTAVKVTPAAVAREAYNKAAAGVSNSTNNANTTNAQIVINQSPGQSAKDVADELERRLEEKNTSALRNARSYHHPAKATP
jgi:hypothetical protein